MYWKFVRVLLLVTTLLFWLSAALDWMLIAAWLLSRHEVCLFMEIGKRLSLWDEISATAGMGMRFACEVHGARYCIGFWAALVLPPLLAAPFILRFQRRLANRLQRLAPES